MTLSSFRACNSKIVLFILELSSQDYMLLLIKDMMSHHFRTVFRACVMFF